MMAFDLSASGFDEFSVVDARRARGHASHAAEAGIEMADPLRIHGGVAFAGDFHEIDAAARGVHFFVPENVGGADRETKTAVDALIDDFVRGWVVRVEGAWEERSDRRVGHQMPPTKRPGLRVFLGSS